MEKKANNMIGEQYIIIKVRDDILCEFELDEQEIPRTRSIPNKTNAIAAKRDICISV